jgi:hypothetical protein
MKVGHFEPDGAIIYLPIGFVPDLFKMYEVGEGTNPSIIIWFERMEDDEASGSQEGMLLTGSTGVVTLLSDAGGITAYDSSGRTPPIGVWRATNTTLLDKIGTSITIVARTATTAGTYCIGTTSGVTEDGESVDRDALFECIATSGNTGSSEPAWPVETSGTVVDGSCTWEKVSDVPLGRRGYQGVTIAAALMTDGQEMYYEAYDADVVKDHGDVASWVDGIYDGVV